MSSRFTVFALFCIAFCPGPMPAQDVTGLWDARIESPGGDIRFGLDLMETGVGLTGFIVNGPERIKIPLVKSSGNKVTILIDHYDSRIDLTLDSDRPDKAESLKGEWRKRRGKNEWVKMVCRATRHVESDSKHSVSDFLGRWAVDFSGSRDPAVAVFKSVKGTNRLLGNFMTTTGDYRYLDGEIRNGKMEISCFDGAHAFLFRAKLDGDDSLKGDFWSSNTWHETWTAKRDPGAKLSDDFKQTSFVAESEMGALSFPDLNGNPTRLDDPRFFGKARIIYVFGSWCPNCHDAADYFAELEAEYGQRGLSILGLAFEVTGDFERDAEQVRKYIARHNVSYPVLIAGISDKATASKAFPVLDRVRSYPTTIFIDRHGDVQAVHTGFTGPATGETYTNLKKKFEGLIESMLND